jgi:hypothetical protein
MPACCQIRRTAMASDAVLRMTAIGRAAIPPFGPKHLVRRSRSALLCRFGPMLKDAMNIATKAVLAWFVLFAVMFANGAIRVVVLQPQLGEDRARQVASLSGVALVLTVSRLFVRLSPEAVPSQLLWVGVAWLTGTLAFEFLFGHFVSGLSWSALLADYNIIRGRLWALILISVCLGPWFWGAVSGRR